MNRNAHILSLMSVAFAAFGLSVGAELRTTLIAAGLLAAAAVASVVFEQRAARGAAAVAGAPVARSTVQTKRLLMLMMAIGIVVYGGGAGTFATFSAETANTNSQVASGTLTMSDAVTGGQTCFSNSATSGSITADNINDLPAQQTLNGQNTTTAIGACDQILNISNIAPGTFAGYASVTIANTGSLDAQKFKMFAPYVNTALATASAIPPSTNLATTYPTGIDVLPIEGPIKSGDSIELDYGGSSFTATAAADANPLTTKLKLTGTTPATVTFQPGTRITDTSTDGLNGLSQQENINCFDVRNSVAQSAGATVGTALNFNGTDKDATTHWVTDNTLTYTGPLCANLGFWIQEQSVVGGNTYNYCWYGDGSPSYPSGHLTNNGMCRAPISASFSGTPPASLPTTTTPATITLSTGLRGNVVATDGIKISELGKAAVTCTANTDAYIGATTLSIKSCSAASPATGGAFTAAAVITDTTTITDLSTDTQTIANFQTLHGANNQLELPTLVGNGSLSNSGATVAAVELGKAGSSGSASGTIGSAPASRKFYFGVYLQTNTATAQNVFQGLKTTFGVGWHLDQF